MTKKLLGLTKVTLLILSISFIFNSCTEETYIENPIHETEWKIQEFSIKSSEWQWSNKAQAYYVDKDLDHLNINIYEEGAIIGYVYNGTQGENETMSVLPFRGTGNIFERIWFDVSYDYGKQVRFYYQWSDLANVRPGDYYFKITMIY